MSRVFVVQRHAIHNAKTGQMVDRFDLSPAEKFGELHFLLSPISVPTNPEEAIRKMRENLHNFSDKDYLLLIGNPCFIGWATAIAADINEGKVKLLQWNGKHKKYHVVESRGLVSWE